MSTLIGQLVCLDEVCKHGCDVSDLHVFLRIIL